MSPEVVILGSGISGLLSAWACERNGRDFVLFDKGPIEALPRMVEGCVYLHDSCGLEEHIRTQVLTTHVLPVKGVPTDELSRLYHRKIWGGIPYEPNSLDRLDWAPIEVYSMNDALRYLHDRYCGSLTIASIGRSDVDEWLRDGKRVISTVPLRVLFDDLDLVAKPLWTFQSAVDGGAGSSAWTVYNVDPEVAWYRMTSMFGNFSVEFIRPPTGSWRVHKFAKIITYDATELDAYHPDLMLTGRWGRWERGFLSHQTYREVLRKFEGEWR